MDQVYGNAEIVFSDLEERQAADLFKGEQDIYANAAEQESGEKQNCPVAENSGAPCRCSLALLVVSCLALLGGLTALGILYVQKSNRSDALEEENRELSISLSSVEQRLAGTERNLEEQQVRDRNESERLSAYRDIKSNLEELQVKHRDLWKKISHYNECTKREVDLAFLFDGSESLKADDFKKNKDFIADIMKTLSNTSTQFAAMQFSKMSRTVFTFKDYQAKTALDLLEKEQHMKDLTNTYGAMNNVLHSILNSTTAGAIPDATKVLVIITDGNPSDKDWKKVVKTMDDRHITRYVIGVGNVARETLTALSSHLPNKNTTFPINDYNGLKGVLDSLQKQIYNIEDVQKSNRSDALEEENRELSISLSSVEQRLAGTERMLVELQVRHRNASETLSAYRDIKRNLEDLQVKHTDLLKTISHYNAMEGCACLTGWRIHQGKCYFFSTEKMHWSQSQEYCTSKGAHLVIINNQQEQNFVSSRISETHWIGLSDRDTEGQWVWVDGTPLDRSGTQYWWKTEPDNWMGAGDPSGEDCAALGDNNEHPDYWFDGSCRNMKKFVCETATNLNESGPEYLVSP
ncbi:integrin alpha-X-like isoform X3 [Anguilla rostrata]|uniref:integrin alpha-X-like isoform X3 n=1 Tax=Anguilla rostrata TaxID=7938 RepID=UPI0030CFE69E